MTGGSLPALGTASALRTASAWATGESGLPAEPGLGGATVLGGAGGLTGPGGLVRGAGVPVTSMVKGTRTEATELDTTMAKLWVPDTPSSGVPTIVAVPSPLSVKVIPSGTAPARLKLATG